MQAPAKGPWNASEPRAPGEPVLLLGGSVRAATESARRGGFFVIAVDRFGDTDTLAACHRHFHLEPSEACITSLQQLPATPLVLAGGLIGVDNFVRRLDSRHPLVGPSLVDRQGLRCPKILQRLSEPTGLNFPPWAEALTSTPAGGRWLWKARGSTGGLGVRWAPEPSRITGSEFHDGYFQQFVGGRPIGVTFLADGRAARMLGACRLTFVRRDRGTLPFVYAGAFGPVRMPGQVAKAVHRFGQACVGAFSLRGLFNVDLVVNRQGKAWLLEVNPRWSGTSELIEEAWRATPQGLPGDSLFRLHWDRMHGSGNEADGWNEAYYRHESGLDTSPESSRFWKRVVFATKTGRFYRRRLRRLPPVAAEMEAGFADVPDDGSPIERGEPIATLKCRTRAGTRTTVAYWRQLIRHVQEAVSTEQPALELSNRP